MATKLDRLVTYLKRLLQSHMAPELRCLLRSCDKLKTHFETKMLVATKFDRVVTYYDRIPRIKSLDPSITWSCEVM